MTVGTYLENISDALGNRLIDPNSIFFGRNGHERFARECGYALNDFDAEEHEGIVSGMYDIYVQHCYGHTILDKKEWETLMRSQTKVSISKNKGGK